MSFTDRAIPLVGPTGSKMIEYKLNYQSNEQAHYSLGPRRPDRCEDVYDEDGEWIAERQLPVEEYERRIAEYERQVKRFGRSGRFIGYTDGVPTIEISILCEDNSVAEGVWNGLAWRWTSWRTNA